MSPQKETMAGSDAAWLRMDRPTNLMMITAVMMFDEVLRLDEVKTVIEQRFLLFDRFRQRVTDREATPHWQADPYFDLDRHIHRVALPAPGGVEPMNLEALNGFVERTQGADFVDASFDAAPCTSESYFLSAIVHRLVY